LHFSVKKMSASAIGSDLPTLANESKLPDLEPPPPSAAAKIGASPLGFNAAPRVFDESDSEDDEAPTANLDSDSRLLQDEIFSLLRHILDPEHQLSLERLRVIRRRAIHVQRDGSGRPSCQMYTCTALSPLT
jgi:hypothetical protein